MPKPSLALCCGCLFNTAHPSPASQVSWEIVLSPKIMTIDLKHLTDLENP